ncbi:DHYS synthase, partial [Nothocercus julius]|nr:DHYS synthase [Nothocercus julius]
QVDVLVTTAGGVEEDLIKCLAPTYVGDFELRGQELRERGINRCGPRTPGPLLGTAGRGTRPAECPLVVPSIGNLLVPNDNYCKFEDWLMPILDKMTDEQDTEGVKWTPSKMIARLGKEIDNPDSVYYWAQKNQIPVLSPALTDGSLGDMIFFHSYKRPGLVLDIVEGEDGARGGGPDAWAPLTAPSPPPDLRLINTQAIFAKRTGMIILGGGLVKHHIANANLMVRGHAGTPRGHPGDRGTLHGGLVPASSPQRNGADFSVYVNTAQEFDGSDSGARPDEAVSWGKIRPDATPVKVYADASLVFPLLVAETFARSAGSFPEPPPGH